ncbi:ferritin-like domain-containing protein [Yinghuangia seranimata]|uniref:ferritin-like domain-containing protein n=1 Tax=Yinghuangia seranimata TaxID=408067 RepID=UPI00248D1274|nr:ferritin-like domain-containing protein [Yinghuangia seranimata]MDI2128055.1 ferritin-like domain-containing protein [Yinghuangia seranimata]
MSTHELYALPAEMQVWEVPATGSARFTWEYDDGRDRLLSLYAKGKDKQWDAARRIDWSLPVDPVKPLGLPEETHALYGTPSWNKMSQRERDELTRHSVAWQFSQFLHGEQGAMVCSARIVESVPDLDAKFYAATQTMDEARHAETYARFLKEKVGLYYPINPQLKELLDDTLSDSRWDMPYLGMQVLIEGLALAAFGMLRDLTPVELPKQILAYVMQDEARHVAFGRLALRDYYRELTDAELAEREDFVVHGCYLMRDRLRGEEVWTNFDIDKREATEATANSEWLRAFRKLLFSRIAPCIKDIGLWGPKVRDAFADMGVLDMADTDLDVMMRADEDTAEEIDRKRRFTAEEAARADEVAEMVALGAED